MSPEKFETFRLSLAARPQGDLFEGPITREKFLRNVFGDRRDFEHFGSKFSYVPVDAGMATLIAGRIGKSRIGATEDQLASQLSTV